MQGDTGAAIVFFAIFLTMSLSAGIKLRYFAALGGIVLVALPLLWMFVMKDYQKARFTAVFNLEDPTVQMEDGYQQYQGASPSAAAGWTGRAV